MMPIINLLTEILLDFDDPDAIQPTRMVELLNYTVNTLLVLCTTDPLPPVNLTNRAIPILGDLLRPRMGFPDALVDQALSGLVSLTRSSNNSALRLLIHSGAIPWILNLNGHSDRICKIGYQQGEEKRIQSYLIEQ
ncbi:unnamed protein product [Arabis nemorensis]|uniref:Uncharacterized protein n=1 Tax=Arabis nemorensis TaxID=586526 RepID=A0A565AMR0_9BRAS|nr:unnamed protein product [Arabis nemorensis]